MALEAKVAELKATGHDVEVIEDDNLIENFKQTREYRLSLIAPIPEDLLVQASITDGAPADRIDSAGYVSTPSQGFYPPVEPRCRYLMCPRGCVARQTYQFVNKKIFQKS